MQVTATATKKKVTATATKKKVTATATAVPSPALAARPRCLSALRVLMRLRLLWLRRADAQKQKVVVRNPCRVLPCPAVSCSVPRSVRAPA